MIVAGVLSGTSLDGIDVAVVDLRLDGPRYAYRIDAFATVPFAAALRDRVLAAYPPATLDALQLGALHADLGDAFGDAVRAVAGERGLDLVASHGLTLAHDGAAHRTLQIGDAFRIRERVGVTVAFDFRAADCAAGGHGAPLAPYLDALCFASAAEDRVALNLGGIANLTVLARGGNIDSVVAFDSGPANIALDTYVAARGLGNGRYDDGGALARAGRPDPGLLAAFLADPYLQQRPPKSTGRERYGAPFIAAHRAALDALAPADALATLAAFTARSVAGAVREHAAPGAAVYVSGGGARNAALLDGLRAALPGSTVEPFTELGVDPDAKEALLFAVLGAELVRGRAANLPRVTGARGPRVLGALAPGANLHALTAACREEER